MIDPQHTYPTQMYTMYKYETFLLFLSPYKSNEQQKNGCFPRCNILCEKYFLQI